MRQRTLVIVVVLLCLAPILAGCGATAGHPQELVGRWASTGAATSQTLVLSADGTAVENGSAAYTWTSPAAGQVTLTSKADGSTLQGAYSAADGSIVFGGAAAATYARADSIWSHWIWPLATAILGFIYVGLLLVQFARRRKMHQLMWAIGFLFYAVAAVMEFWSEMTLHWDPTVYRFYIVLAASLVGFLGNGTLYLVSKKRLWGDLYLAFNLVCLAIFLYGTLTASLLMDKLVPGIVVGGQALGESGTFPRLMSLPFNIPGTIILIGGAVLSIIKFWPKKAFRYRVWANVLIIVGTLMIAGAGSLARLGSTGGLYVGEMIASAVLLWGFLLASTLDKGAQAVKAEQAAKKAAAG